MRICIGIPNPQFIHPDFALVNLPQIIAHAKSSIPDLELFIKNKEGVMTSSNRNFILKQCLEEDIDAILWLDTDQIYPADILKLMVDSGKDIIGSIYYKRAKPYDPNVFVKGNNPIRPYQIVDTKRIAKGQIVEVDGLGFGGLFVKMDVYRAMGDEKWMRYGRNFGIPIEMEDQLSHDLVFCETAKRYGYKIHVHGSSRCGHIADQLITDDSWMGSDIQSSKKIAVILPSVDTAKAQKTIEQLQSRAAIHADYYIIEDVEGNGFIAVCNDAVHSIDADYYVYVAEDSYGGQDWLKIAFECMEKDRGGLLAFNDGKWHGTLASVGMVSREWMIGNYDGNMFYSGYKSHYADTELTLLAKKQNKLVYNPSSVVIEVDYEKHGVNINDKNLFSQRVQLLQLPELFS